MANPKPKASIAKFLLSILFFLTIFSSILLLTCLAQDAFTLPYLTPFAHWLKTVLSPFVPLLAPFFLGIFLKFCQHTPFPRKKTWLVVSGSWLFQQTQRVFGDIYRLVKSFKYDETGRRGLNGVEMEVCGLRECGSEWLEVGLILVVVLCQWRGWQWDGGYLDKWVEQLVVKSWEEEQGKKAQKEGDNMEKGVIGVEEVEEKVELPAESARTFTKHALQQYQMQLTLLEQQNKKRLTIKGQEQNNIADKNERPLEEEILFDVANGRRRRSSSLI